MSVALWIAVVTVILFLLSILFSINFRFGCKIRIPAYILVSVLGGAAMVLFGQISLADIGGSFLENTSVNPIKILVLFLSMTVFSLILERTNFFRFVSSSVLKRAGKNQYVIFVCLYAINSLLTVFTSNDIIILTFTPFICHFCKAANINAIPYLIMEFVAANTWSLLFIIGNPTNIYISSAFGIGFFDYFTKMAIPTIIVGVVSFFCMMLLFGRSLKKDITPSVEVEKITNVPLMIISLGHLLLCVATLVISQYINMEMWIIAFGMALSVIVCSMVCLACQRRGLADVGEALKKMPFEIIPFIIGMFVIVLALDKTGATAWFAGLFLGTDSVFGVGFASLAGSNILNNIPMSVLFSKILVFGASEAQLYATVIASNVGAFITPVGALAGIMWSNLLRANKVHISVRRFIFYGIVIGIPAFTASLLFLEFIM